MKIHLVDGTYELFRAYYGVPSLLSSKGLEIGATIGFMQSLAKLLRSPEVTHLAVAFDTVIESFRNELFDGYKTGDGIEPALWAQFPLVEQATAAMGIVGWSMIEFEADDAIATAARRWQDEKGVTQVVICSPDKDFGQCINKKIVMWDRLRDRVLDEAGVVEKFGVGPASIPDWLALVGDTADGIPGVPRWGAKSAAQILAHYQHLEKIPHNVEDWTVKLRGAAGLAESLNQNRTEAKLYRKLATLRYDVPLKEKLNDLKWQQLNKAQIKKFGEELGLADLDKKLNL